MHLIFNQYMRPPKKWMKKETKTVICQTLLVREMTPLMILCRGAPSEGVPSMIIVACLFDLGLNLGTTVSWHRKSCRPSPLKNDSYGGRVPIRIPRVELTGQ